MGVEPRLSDPQAHNAPLTGQPPVLLTRGKGPREQAANCLSQALGSWTPCDCRAAGAGAHTGVFLTLGHWGRLLLGIFLLPTLLFLLINMLTFLPAPPGPATAVR